MNSIETVFQDLPRNEYKITSKATAAYNSVAWAISEEENDCCWWPVPYAEDVYPWPAQREETLDAFVEVYQSVGYEVCISEEPEPGFEKVAIYVDKGGKPTHVARQFSRIEGNVEKWAWTSKVIELEDIEHKSLSTLNSAFGSVAKLLKRSL